MCTIFATAESDLHVSFPLIAHHYCPQVLFCFFFSLKTFYFYHPKPQKAVLRFTANGTASLPKNRKTQGLSTMSAFRVTVMAMTFKISIVKTYSCTFTAFCTKVTLVLWHQSWQHKSKIQLFFLKMCMLLTFLYIYHCFFICLHKK